MSSFIETQNRTRVTRAQYFSVFVFINNINHHNNITLLTTYLTRTTIPCYFHTFPFIIWQRTTRDRGKEIFKVNNAAFLKTDHKYSYNRS